MLSVDNNRKSNGEKTAHRILSFMRKEKYQIGQKRKMMDRI